MTAKPAAVNDAMLQLLWVLFSDANSRFNTLIEECAHLQDTVIGLTTDPALLDRIIHECAADDAVRGFSRVVCCQPKRSREYYRVCVRDRAFLSLWTLLGGLIIALDKNQLTHEETYRLAVDALLRGEHAPDAADDAPQRRPSDRVFWYIQTRGYFLTEVFRHYTTQLEHAHEKVIQMLENQPGKLPTPILLRRWNSAMYGEFLSEYSRHVNWEAHKLVSIAAGRDPADADASAKLTEDLSLTHTWTHQPTSMAQLFKVEVKTDRGDPARNYPHKRAAGHRFATVRSAYFYMEQPILLPLLYHECAHIAFSNRAFAGAQGDGHHPAGVETFFSARAAAMQSLRMIKFPDGTAQAHYENFWDHFTEEVWADALALALGGRGYLVALALQLFGLSGEESFDHFDLDTDTVHELGGLGRPAKRKYPEPRPQEEVSYFWEARLQIACDLLAHRGDCRTPECDRRWISAIRDLLAGYARSGARAHAREGTSARHEVLWEYRAKLNDWVRNTTGRYLLQHFGALFGNSPVCTTYELATAQERRCLESLVRAYRQRYMPQFRGHSEFRLDEHHRLEHLPADIRWHVARDITAAMRASEACPPITSWQELAPTEPSSSAPPLIRPSSIEDWSQRYANWMRHDGGVAFRVALEASRLRLSLLDALADEVERVQAEHRQQAAGGPAAKSGVAFLPPFHTLSAEAVRDSARCGDIVGQLRRRQITNTRRQDSGWTKAALRLVEDRVGREMDRLLDYFVSLDEPPSSGTGAAPAPRAGQARGEAPVGTLALGIIRPDEIARQSTTAGGSPYLASLNALEGQWKWSRDRHAEVATGAGPPFLRSRPSIGTAYARLLGDYQFLAYAKGTTPVERDFHAHGDVASLAGDAEPRLIRRLVKPRMVLQLAGTELKAAIEAHGASHWGRLSLIRFRYRWQWTELVDRLEGDLANEPAPVGERLLGYSLLSSSAWEDVILITWYDSQKPLWKAMRRLSLAPGLYSGMDIQSTFLPPTDCCGSDCPAVALTPPDLAHARERHERSQAADEPRPSDWEIAFFEWARQCGAVDRVYSRSGRYDYTVLWKQDSPGEPTDVLGHCMRGLASIPKEVWQQVSSVISSYEVRRWHLEGNEPVIDPLSQLTNEAVTHFAIKNRI